MGPYTVAPTAADYTPRLPGSATSETSEERGGHSELVRGGSSGHHPQGARRTRETSPRGWQGRRGRPEGDGETTLGEDRVSEQS